MAHISLCVPVAHIWFLRGTPSPISLILDVGIRDLERVVYFANFIVTDVDEKAKADAIADLKKDYESKHKDILKKHGIKDFKNDVISDEAAKELAELRCKLVSSKNRLNRPSKISTVTRR
jgi:DNA-directed RNA polymerase subunit beta'